MLGSGRACVLGGVVAAPPVGWALIPADHDGAPPLGKATFPYQSNFHGASSVSNRSAGATAHSPFLVVSRPLGTPRHGTRCDWRAAVRARVRAPTSLTPKSSSGTSVVIGFAGRPRRRPSGAARRPRSALAPPFALL